MKEIGGYLALEPLVSNPYYAELIPVNSARNAALYILRAKKAKKVWLPYFLCDSVSGVCDREGIPYEFYHIGANFEPLFDRELAENEWLYIVNYYGQIDADTALGYQKRYGNVIFDNVQAFFQRPVDGMPTVYSCRKFFGVPDGGYAACDTKWNEPLPKDTSGDRLTHLLGRLESGSASAYYAEYQASNRRFKDLELREMSDFTKNLMGAIDYAAVKKRREDNFRFLDVQLGSQNQLQLKLPEGAFAYPFYHPNGMMLKKRLAAEKIYVPTLWPNVLELADGIEKDYAENILPLPCDQRYDAEDMARICSEIARLE